MKSSLIFLSGVGLGVVLGLLFAPEPGRVTLLKVKAEADRMVDKVLSKATVEPTGTTSGRAGRERELELN